MFNSTGQAINKKKEQAYGQKFKGHIIISSDLLAIGEKKLKPFVFQPQNTIFGHFM